MCAAARLCTASKVSVSSKSGKAKYKAGQNNVIWKMKTFSGGKSTSCEVSIDLLPATGKSKWTRPPISLSFEAPFACSGLQVKYLIVAEPKLGYDDSTVLKWVRYLSKSHAVDPAPPAPASSLSLSLSLLRLLLTLCSSTA